MRHAALLLSVLALSSSHGLTAEGAAPAYEVHAGVDDSAATGAQDSEFVKQLGPAASIGACASLCSAWSNSSNPAEQCESFTLYNGSAPPPIRGKCFGHVTRVWVPHVSDCATSVRPDRHFPPPQSFPHTNLISRCGTGAHGPPLRLGLGLLSERSLQLERPLCVRRWLGRLALWHAVAGQGGPYAARSPLPLIYPSFQ